MSKRTIISISLIMAIVIAAVIFLKLKSDTHMNKPNAVEATLSEKTPQILVLESTASGCTLKVLKNLDEGFQKWFQLPKCPEKTENLIFAASQNRVLILQEEKYWTAEKKLGVDPQFLAEAFKSPVEGEIFSKTWIDKISKSLSVAYLIQIAADLKENPEGDELRKKLPLLKDTWISLHHADGSPPEGAPAVAVVARLNDSNQWQILAEEKTACCADMAPGLDVVKDQIIEQEGVYSLFDLLTKSICQTQQCDMAKLNPSESTREWIKSTFNENEEEPVVYVPMGTDDGFIFHTEFGDSLHAMGPIYYCKNNCSDHELIESPKSIPDFGQVSFSSKLGFMMISTEYEGKDAKIYQAGLSKPILSLGSSSRAVWLPDNFQF